MFYTYCHVRNDTNKVFYVGKGNADRAYSCADRNSHWKRIVAKHGHAVYIAAHWPTEAEAFEHEKFLILCFRDMGYTLANHTDGGEGASGYKQLPAAKQKISATHFGKHKTEAHCKKLAESNSNKKPVVCITTGEVFHSARQAARKIGGGVDTIRISEVCLGKAKSTHGLKFQFVNEFHRKEALLKYPPKPEQKRPTICISTGQVFESIQAAANAFNMDSRPVGECCHGKLKTTGGLKFQFADSISQPQKESVSNGNQTR